MSSSPNIDLVSKLYDPRNTPHHLHCHYEPYSPSPTPLYTSADIFSSLASCNLALASSILDKPQQPVPAFKNFSHAINCPCKDSSTLPLPSSSIVNHPLTLPSFVGTFSTSQHPHHPSVIVSPHLNTLTSLLHLYFAFRDPAEPYFMSCSALLMLLLCFCCLLLLRMSVVT